MKIPLVKYRDEVQPTPCPYGTTTRVVTGGEGGVANVHIISVTRGGLHYHSAYDETYYLLSGEGKIRLDGCEYVLRPGAVVVIPAGVAHELESGTEAPLEFVIFGTPALPIESKEARPLKLP